MIKNYLKRKVKGAAAVEYVMLVPLMAVAFMACLYFLFICLSYIFFNSTANIVAQQLNKRQSGYENARLDIAPTFVYSLWEANIYKEASQYDVYDSARFIQGNVSPLDLSEASITASNEDLKKAAYYIIQKNIA